MRLSKEVKNNLEAFKATRTEDQTVLDTPLPHAASTDEITGKYSTIAGNVAVKEGDDLLDRLGYVFPIVSAYDKKKLRPLKKRWDPEIDLITISINDDAKKMKKRTYLALANKVAKERSLKAYPKRDMIAPAPEVVDLLTRKEQQHGAYIRHRLLHNDELLSEHSVRNEPVSPEAEYLASLVDMSLRKKDGQLPIEKNQAIPKDTIKATYEQTVELFQKLQEVTLDGVVLFSRKNAARKLGRQDPKTVFFEDKHVTFFPPQAERKDPSQKMSIYIEDPVDIRDGSAHYTFLQLGNDTFFSIEKGIRFKMGGKQVVYETLLHANDRYAPKDSITAFQNEEQLLQQLFEQFSRQKNGGNI